MTSERELTFLTREGCLRRLAGSEIGRVVFNREAMPAIQPVTFALNGYEIIFRAAKGAKLAAALRGSVAAFEVDEIDSCTRTGWSVVCIGRSYEITDPTRLAVLAEIMPAPSAPHRTAHTIAIGIEVITGRELRLSDGINQDLFAHRH